MTVTSSWSSPASALVNETARAERQAAAARTTAAVASQSGGQRGSFVQLLASQQGMVGGGNSEPSPAAPQAATRPMQDCSHLGELQSGDRARTQPARPASTSPRPTDGDARGQSADRPWPPGHNPDAQESAVAAADAASDAQENLPAPGRQEDVPPAQAGQTLAQWLQQIGVLASGPGGSAWAANRPQADAAGGDLDGEGPLATQNDGNGLTLKGGMPTLAQTQTARMRWAGSGELPGQGNAEGALLQERAAGVAGPGDAGQGPPSVASSGAMEVRSAEAAAEHPKGLGAERAPGVGAASGGFEAVLGAARVGMESLQGSVQASNPSVGAEAVVSTPVGEPGAGDEVILHVSRYVREGVREARLHLNPMEMGPIEVRIALEGGQARIDFAAAHEATRDLLQAHVPALARALEAEGVKLTAAEVTAQTSGAGDSRDAASSSPMDRGAGGEGRNDAGRGGAGGGGGERAGRENATSERTPTAAASHGSSDLHIGDEQAGPSLPLGRLTPARALDLYA